jgi:hypothetical protein
MSGGVDHSRVMDSTPGGAAPAGRSARTPATSSPGGVFAWTRSGALLTPRSVLTTTASEASTLSDGPSREMWALAMAS